MPLRGGYAEALVGASSLTGPFARLEVGEHLLPRLGLYGFGQWTPRESTAGAGLRVTW